MTHPALTAEQRAAYKTRADRVQEILRDLKDLETIRPRAIGCDLYDGQSICGFALATRIVTLGIDTLIAQLEQELEDLDRPKVANIPQFSFAEPQAACPHISTSMWTVDGKAACFDCGLALDSKQVTPRQIERRSAEEVARELVANFDKNNQWANAHKPAEARP